MARDSCEQIHAVPKLIRLDGPVHPMVPRICDGLQEACADELVSANDSPVFFLFQV